ncbi:hypothetical protein L0244_29885, partial [bacterium]|nr:hypothetical protein [bacterium]
MKIENIPSELQQLTQWVGYKLIPQGDSKPKKMPINPKTGVEAKVNDSSTWGTFQQATNNMKRYGYQFVGFVF